MLRFVRIPTLARSVSTSRTLLMGLHTPLTSLNNAAANAKLDMYESLDEMAARHFSEASAFPEFSPAEDLLLGQTVAHMQPKKPEMDPHALAVEELMAEMQQHFCESSDFPEYTPVEEEAIMLKDV